MRYIIIPLAIILYCIWTYHTFKTIKENGFDSMWHEQSPTFESMWIFLHSLIVLMSGLGFIIGISIKYW